MHIIEKFAKSVYKPNAKAPQIKKNFIAQSAVSDYQYIVPRDSSQKNIKSWSTIQLISTSNSSSIGLFGTSDVLQNYPDNSIISNKCI